MKKLIPLLVIAFIFYFPKALKAQHNFRQFVIDFNYGYSLLGEAEDAFYIGNLTSKEKFYFGPIGIKAEYLICDKIGAGFEFNYRAKQIDVSYNGFNQYDSHVHFTSLQYIAMGRLCYYIQNEKAIQTYTGFAAGAKYKYFDIQANEPGYYYEDDIFNHPLTARVYAGFRYFFNENIGVNAELGIGGGSLFNGGVSIGLDKQFLFQ